MIYLTNTVSAQTVSIPRNDNGGTPSVNPRSYQSGYTDGVAYQKSLLSSTAITQNGEYSRENGFSAVSVNVPQTGSSLPLTAITITANTAITESEKAYTGITVNVPQTGYTQQDLDNAYDSGYTSGSTDGYSSGYTEGVDFQKAALTSITISQNGEYIRENGYSAITVNVSGSPVVLESKTVDLSDGFDPDYGMTVTPSSGYDGLSQVIINDNGYSQAKYDEGYQDGQASMADEYQKGYDDGFTIGYDSGYSDGYASGETDGYNTGYASGYTSGETDGYNTGYTSGYTSGLQTYYSGGLRNIETNGAVRNSAFYSYQYLTGATIKNGVIGWSAFENCIYLTNVTLENVYINGDAFKNTAITAITIPYNTEEIGHRAFADCRSLERLEFMGTNNRINFGDDVFSGCSALTLIYCHSQIPLLVFEDTFDGISPTGTVHYPADSDYSSWQNLTVFANWTFIDDL